MMIFNAIEKRVIILPKRGQDALPCRVQRGGIPFGQEVETRERGSRGQSL